MHGVTMTSQGSEPMSVTTLLPASLTSLSQSATRQLSPSYPPVFFFFCLKIFIIILISFCSHAFLPYSDPIFPNYIKELPTSFPLPGSGRYSVVLPAQKRDVVNPSVQGNGVLGSQNSKGSPVSPAHSRLQATPFGWHCQAELKQFLLTL